jgi:hypothetical protein
MHIVAVAFSVKLIILISLILDHLLITLVFSNVIDVRNMANSIRQHNLLQPIVVRTKEDHFEDYSRLLEIFSMQIFDLEEDRLSYCTIK